jgi:hypothetical protein
MRFWQQEAVIVKQTNVVIVSVQARAIWRPVVCQKLKLN